MKRALSILLLTITIYSVSAQLTYALFGVGDIVFDPTVNSSTLLTYAKEIISSAANTTTAANTTYQFVKDTVLNPLANALIIVTQLQQTSNTINLITGSLGGNSLLIQNPEQWIRNQGLNSVRISIGDLSSQNGTYTNSILGSIVTTYRSNSDLKSTITALSQSSIPSMVQKKICLDASLTNIARNDVMKNDGTFDPIDLQRRKTELFDSLCRGNPSVSINLSKKLEEINKQRPDIVGLDGIIAVSFGDNEYNRNLQTQLALAEDVASKQKAAENDLNRGGGIASKVKCNDPVRPTSAEYDATIANLPCRLQSITNTGSALNSAFQESINSPLKNLMSTFGPSAGENIVQILTLISSARQISNAFNSAPSGTANLAPVQNLTNQADQAQAADTVVKPLKDQMLALNTLEATEGDLLSALAGYESDVSGVKSCFNRLVQDFGLQNDPRIIAAFVYTDSTLNKIQFNRAESDKNLNNIDTTRSLVNDALSFIATSKSTQEILNTFMTLQNNLEKRGLPTLAYATKRQADVVTLNSQIENDRGYTGKIPTLTSQCAQIRQSLSPREAP